MKVSIKIYNDVSSNKKRIKEKYIRKFISNKLFISLNHWK